jgi:hypothetical protein
LSGEQVAMPFSGKTCGFWTQGRSAVASEKHAREHF